MTTFQNPASFADPDLTNPDPFVLNYMGAYYCYATDEEGVRVSSSADLVNWEYHGLAFTEAGRRAFWAPCVIYRNGVFYMYVSDRPAGEDDNHLQRLRVAIATSPLGPFTTVRTLKDCFAIDADVVFDQNGKPYMFYASNEFTGLSAERPGTAIVMDRMTDLTHLADTPVPVVLPTLPQEVFAENRFGDGRNWHTIEGGAYFTRRGHAYMTYSGNAYVRPDYFIGYTRARRDRGIADLQWTKMPDDHTFAPLMRRSESVEGTGHNSVIQAPNLVDWWIVYHGRDAAQELLLDREQRVMRLDRLYFDGDSLWTDGPSTDRRHAPGEASIDVREVTPIDPGPQVERILADTVGPYVAEVYLRAQVTDSGARYGLVPLRRSEQDRYVVWFDAGSRTVSARRQRGDLWHEVASAELRDFDFAQWQPLQIERRLAEVLIRRGEEILLKFPHDYGNRSASVSILGQYTHAEIGYFRLTGHVDWHALQGDAIAWVLEADRPTQVTSEGIWAEASELRFRQPFGTSTEVALDFWLPSPQSRVCLVTTGQEERWFLGTDSDRTTVRIRVTANETTPTIRLHRAALTGLTCTDIN